MNKINGVRAWENEPMAMHSTLGVGGPADIYAEVTSEFGLVSLMQYISSCGLPWMVVGDGTNLLVSDLGIRGVVLSLGGEFQEVKICKPYVEAGASARLSAIADLAADNDLSGFEGIGVVPGTVGGAIVMNAGTYLGYINQFLVNVHVVNERGSKLVLSRDECGFSYRNSRFQHDRSFVITRALFKLQPADWASVRRVMESVRDYRAKSHPQGKSAGCFFKNPSGASFSANSDDDSCISAGKLIELAGCKGLSEGDAVVSDIHANFIINRGHASATDIRNLAERVRAIVKEKTGVDLEYEVRIVGEW
ncbi:MAG: UDP-N-acetylmuramate dehydrogenase [Armatimonadota bacterium]